MDEKKPRARRTAKRTKPGVSDYAWVKKVAEKPIPEAKIGLSHEDRMALVRRGHRLSLIDELPQRITDYNDANDRLNANALESLRAEMQIMKSNFDRRAGDMLDIALRQLSPLGLLKRWWKAKR